MRNTEEAEKISRGPEHSGGGGSGRGLGKGVWGMIEESELAKTIRKGEGKTVCSVPNEFGIEINHHTDI